MPRFSCCCFADQLTKLKYIFRGARFFLVKSNNHENVALAKAKGVWATPPPNETRFNGAFRVSHCCICEYMIVHPVHVNNNGSQLVVFNRLLQENPNVILIFSVKESGRFQGFARVASESDKDHVQVRWVLPPGLSQRALSGIFKLDWINRFKRSAESILLYF